MFRLLLILAGAIVLVQINDAKPLDQAIIAVALACVLAFVWSRLSVRNLTIRRVPLIEHASVGELFSEQLTLANNSIVPKPWLEVLDFSTLPGHAAGQVVRVKSKGSVHWTAGSVCSHRGQFHLGPIRVRSGDPFGIFSRTVIAPDTMPILVWPIAISLPSFREPGGLFSGGPQSGWSPFTSPSVAGVRDYVPGDPFNRIAWSATARTSRLMVKEFEQDPVADVWVVLDLCGEVQRAATISGEPSQPRRPATDYWLDSTVEYGVALAASICRTYLERGRSVGFIATCLQPIVLSPDRGTTQTARILDNLAVVSANGTQSLETALRAHETRFNRRVSLVAISSSLDERWGEELGRLASSGIATQAVMIQPETFDGIGSSLPLIGAMIARGVPVSTVAYGDRLEHLSNVEIGGGVLSAAY